MNEQTNERTTILQPTTQRLVEERNVNGYLHVRSFNYFIYLGIKHLAHTENVMPIILWCGF